MESNPGIHQNLQTIVSGLEALGLCIAIKNAQLEYVFTNKSYANLLGMDAGIKRDHDLFIPEVAFEVSQEENQLLISGEEHKLERLFITKNDVKVVVEVSRCVIQSDNEPHLLILIKDITEDKQNERFDAMQRVLSTEEIFEKILNQFSHFIFRTNQKKEVLEGVCRLGVELLGLEDFAVYTKEGDQLIQKANYLKERGLVYDENGALILDLTQGICGQTFQNKKTNHVTDTATNVHYRQGLPGAIEELCVPIIYKGEVLGLLDSESTKPGVYTSNVKKQLEHIASLLAIKLHEIEYLQELESREDILSTFVQNSAAPMILIDKSLSVIDFSEAFLNNYHISKDEIVGKSVKDFINNHPVRFYRALDKSLGGKTVEVNNEKINFLGTIGWFDFVVKPWMVDEEIKGLLLVVTDNTEKRGTQLKLDSSIEELQQIKALGKINNWSFCPVEGLFSWDSGSISLAISEKLNADEIGSYLPDSYREEFYQTLQYALSNKKKFELIHPLIINDRTIWVHNTGQLQEHEEGKVCFQGSARDITDQMNAETALEDKVKELQKLNEELDQFVYKTAHDLRAPLANVSGLINVMRNISDPSLLPAYLDLQEQSITKLDSFILSISNFTKNARLPVVIDPINMGLLIDDILNGFLYAPNSDKVKKMVNVEAGVNFFSDKTRVETILRNLVDNALKYANTENEAQLSLAISLEKEVIVIKVRDNGFGIPENVLDRVFDMFYRGSNLSQGAGIGLYIVKETVEKLNGVIHVESKEKEYTEFIVKLPNASTTI